LRAFGDDCPLFAARYFRSCFYSGYLTERSPSGAKSVADEIQATVDLLGRTPEMGRPFQQRLQVRVMPVVRYPYLIFYTVRGDILLVLHIRHGARAPLQPDEL
jgi:toxin ParE1/3/4